MYNATPPEIAWNVILPILIVAGTGILALLPEIFDPKRDNALAIMLSIGGLLLAAVTVVYQYGHPDLITFGGMVTRDAFGLSMQLLIIVATLLTIIFSEGYLREKRIPFGEFYPLILWSASGAMLMCTSQNL